MGTQMNISTETVTPAIAREWLTHNIDNRSPREASIESYAQDMLAGRWQLTGESIKFAEDGRLLDGQNRLMAVIKSGIPIETVVVRGLDPRSQIAMDGGIARTSGDALGFARQDGESKYLLGATSRNCLAWTMGWIKHSRQTIGAVSTSAIVEFVQTDPRIHQAVQLGSKYGRSGKARLTMPSPAPLGFFAWLATGRGATWEDVESFAADVSEARSDGAGDPRAAVIQRFMSAQTSRESLNTVSQTHIFSRGWNAYRAGEQLHRIQLTKGADPMPFCVPLP